MKVLILAGGSGTRLWPLSRVYHPKQFLKLWGETSLFQSTVLRFLAFCNPEDLLIVSHDRFRFEIETQLRELALEPGRIPCLYEPFSRNTAPAITLGLRYLKESRGVPGAEMIVVAPSDHKIAPEEAFRDLILLGERFLHRREAILVVGVPPRSPDPGFGYIVIKKEEDGGGVYSVEQFEEKPSLERALQLLDTGRSFWNAGIFLFALSTMERALKEHCPEIARILEAPAEEISQLYPELPSLSLDYAVMERSKNLAMIPFSGTWSDLGSYAALYEALEKDQRGNATRGEVRMLDTQNALILGGKQLLVTLGVKDLVIVDSGDALLVASREETHRVREIAALLDKEGRKEVREPRTVYRPWGSYTILEEGERFKVKRITVLPGSRLSLQRHLHRSEHWVVVKGTARVTIEDRVILLSENESVFVPAGKKHRLENPGKIPLEIVEVQSGAYVEEDDIERYDDDYGRDRNG